MLKTRLERDKRKIESITRDNKNLKEELDKIKQQLNTILLLLPQKEKA